MIRPLCGKCIASGIERQEGEWHSQAERDVCMAPVAEALPDVVERLALQTFTTFLSREARLHL